MVLRIIMFMLCPCLLLSACGGGGSGSTATAEDNNPNVHALGNNAAILDGTQLGYGSEQNSSLSKSISVVHSSADFRITNARVTRSDTNSTFFYVVMRLQNVSTQILCEITLNNLQYQQVSTGIPVTLASTSQGTIEGSYGKMANAVQHSSCLAPGQSGYFLDGIQKTVDFAFGDIDEVEIGGFDVVVADKIVNYRLLPQGYTVNNDPAGTTADVGIKNLNVFSLKLYSPKCRYILLDDSGAPLIWGYLLSDPTTVDIPPSDTANITGGIYFTGSSKKMIVYLVYGSS